MYAIGSDHGGYKLKEEIKRYLEENGIEYEDFGTDSEERTDYPIYAAKVAEAVQSGKFEGGILCCRSGNGMHIELLQIRNAQCEMRNSSFES